MKTIEEIITDIGIEEVLHFTTNYGLIGSFKTGHLLSRSNLDNDQSLEYITKHNSKYRSDSDWIKYVNLSLSRINESFFNHSQNWHRDVNDFWVIFSFSPEILTHRDVVFTTTNNIYRRECKRATGPNGLSSMFEQTVKSRNNSTVYRDVETPRNWTTCREAEVLYPYEVDLKYLNKIYVKDDVTCTLAEACLCCLTDLQNVQLEVNKEKFEGL